MGEGHCRLATDAGPIPVRLQLLDGFRLTAGDRMITKPLGLQRLLAYLAVRRRPQLRTHLAGVLWTDDTEQRARANLRTALWRLKESGTALVQVSPDHVALADHVTVDLQQSHDLANRIMRGEGLNLRPIPEDLLAHELLPDWYDDWLLIERERHRQLRLHALENLSIRLRCDGSYGRAIQAGLTAIAAEPLRESAHRCVIEAHLAEGNRCEAYRQFGAYRDLTTSQLGCEPSEQLRSLVRPVRGGRA